MSGLEELLYKGESETLDFKRDQYAFAGADDRMKAKLLKDILAMANAWRSTPAYVLTGVDAPPGKSPTVVGISDHVDDANLQQFVNSKTNRPVTFNYSETKLQGQTVGVIQIPVQQRPVYLRNDFGGLEAEVAYIRRGSSTGEASLEEIAKMGATSGLVGTDLKVEFASVDTRKILGSEAKIECTAITVAEEPDLPDYAPARRTGGQFDFVIPVLEKPNPDYWRELVDYAKNAMLLQKIALTVTNAGGLSANTIRVEFEINDPDGKWKFCGPGDFKDRPPGKNRGSFDYAVGIKPTFLREPGCDIEYSGGKWYLSFDFGDLQPQRTLWPAVQFYAGCRESCSLVLAGRVLADELPVAGECKLTLTADTKCIQTDLDNLERACARNRDS